MVALAGSPNSHRGALRSARGFSGGPSSGKSNSHRGLYSRKCGFTEGDHYIDELIGYTRTKPGKASERFFAHANHLYSVAAVTDAAGNVRERSKYDAYGKRSLTNSVGATLATSAVGNVTAFTGRSVDGETGLMYFRARMYAPAQGRFPSRDHLGYVEGASLYAGYFVPKGVDPFGNQTLTWDSFPNFPTFVAQPICDQLAELIRAATEGKCLDWKYFCKIVDVGIDIDYPWWWNALGAGNAVNRIKEAIDQHAQAVKPVLEKIDFRCEGTRSCSSGKTCCDKKDYSTTVKFPDINVFTFDISNILSSTPSIQFVGNGRSGEGNVTLTVTLTIECSGGGKIGDCK